MVRIFYTPSSSYSSARTWLNMSVSKIWIQSVSLLNNLWRPVVSTLLPLYFIKRNYLLFRQLCLSFLLSLPFSSFFCHFFKENLNDLSDFCKTGFIFYVYADSVTLCCLRCRNIAGVFRLP